MRSFAIIPAAGASQRMGRPKLLLPWGSTTVIEHVLTQWRQSRVDETIVVVSPDNGPLIEVCRREGCRLVIPDSPPVDMLASIQHGLRYVERRLTPQAADAWLVAP